MVDSKSSLTKTHPDRCPRLKKMLMMFLLTGIDLSSFITLSFLRAIKPFKLIKLYRVGCGRIGHLASNTDLFLRRLQLKTIRKEGVLYLGIVSSKPANNQLLKMFKRKLLIIQLPDIKVLHKDIGAIFDEHSVLSNLSKSFNQRPPRYSISKSIFYQRLPFKSNEYYEFSNTKPNLSFTEPEEEEGKELLSKMGVDSWFVCFHSRDPNYLSKKDKSRDWSYHDFRDCGVKNFMKAAEYITSQGGFTIRMGCEVSEKLPPSDNPRIIDYASDYRSDFGDIYLSAKCKFFIGNTGGLIIVPTIFNIPIVGTNFIPFHTPLRKGDLFIPKKIWSIKKRHFLTFKEQLDFEHKEKNIWFRLGERYAEAGLKPVQNSPEEILDLTKEMNERLDGTFKYTKEDEKLQKKFHSLIKPHHHCHGTPARMGAKFLRQNKELLK